MISDSDTLLKLQLCGDYEDHFFTTFSVGIVSGETRYGILLHENQTNMASWYDDPFKPVEGLINILYDSGRHFAFEIVIENGDAESAAEFLATHNGRVVRSSEPRRDVLIVSSVPSDPDQGNIELTSDSGHTFTIMMECNDGPVGTPDGFGSELTTSKGIEALETLFN
jgi:hypothetical protein